MAKCYRAWGQGGFGRCLWIHLRTLEEVERVQDQKECFVGDVKEFYTSTIPELDV